MVLPLTIRSGKHLEFFFLIILSNPSASPIIKTHLKSDPSVYFPRAVQ